VQNVGGLKQSSRKKVIKNALNQIFGLVAGISRRLAELKNVKRPGRELRLMGFS